MITSEHVRQMVQHHLEGTTHFLVAVELRPGNKLVVEVDNDRAITLQELADLNRAVRDTLGTEADDSTICAGTLPYLDGVVEHLGEVFGRPHAEVSYYWLPDGTDAYCPPGVEGCVGDRGTFSRHTIHQHELAHAVRWPSRLYLPFEEGLAEAFGDDWNRFPVQGDIHDLLEDPVGNHYLPGGGYGLAAHFVSYLDVDYGLETLIELDRSTDYRQSYASASSAFERVYGEPLDDVVDDYEAEYPRCSTLTFRDKSYDCSRNVIAAPTVLGLAERIAALQGELAEHQDVAAMLAELEGLSDEDARALLTTEPSATAAG